VQHLRFLASWIARNHIARTLVQVLGVMVIGLLFGLPGDLVLYGMLGFGGVMLLGGPSVSRFGFKEPE
jgi:hypothetical protein